MGSSVWFACRRGLVQQFLLNQLQQPLDVFIVQLGSLTGVSRCSTGYNNPRLRHSARRFNLYIINSLFNNTRDYEKVREREIGTYVYRGRRG